MTPPEDRGRKAHASARLLAGRARLMGAGFKGPTLTEWDISGRCLTPETIERHTRDPDGVTAPVWLILTVPCRKCERCLRRRAMEWRNRARAETQLASRTWFGTLTFKPEEHMLCLARARLRAAKSLVDFDEMSFKDQFDYRHREMVPLVTRYLKRVRKEAATRFRYLVVAEHHKQALQGMPHYHLLVHERGGLPPVRHAVLRDQWTEHGFSLWKLVEDDNQQAVGYVCKYLSKTSAARVRASRWYGCGGKPTTNSASSPSELASREPVDPKQIPF